MVDTPTEAVEAAVQAIRDSLQFPDSAPADAWPRIAKIALTAAAPHIAAQATADLRAKIEALRDEMDRAIARIESVHHDGYDDVGAATCTSPRDHGKRSVYNEVAERLDALLREGE